MFTKRRNRREFMKMASGLIAAPLGSLSTFAHGETSNPSPLRFLTIIDHFGISLDGRDETWISSTSGDYALTDDNLGTILQPLKAYRDNMLIVSGINLDSSLRTTEITNHGMFVHHTLGASTPLDEFDYKTPTARILHESVDVTIGNYLNNSNMQNNRAYPHLFFTDYAQTREPTYCYDTSGILIRSHSGARDAVSRLFGSIESDNIDPVMEAQVLAQKSVLDKVSSRVQTLRNEFSNTNYREKLNAYSDSVDSLATQLDLIQSQSCNVPDNFSQLSGASRDLPEAARGDILKVIGQLFTCDMASSVTYAFGGELMNRLKHGFLDSGGDSDVEFFLTEHLHKASHRKDEIGAKVHESVRIHQSEIIAELVDQLSNTMDVDGNTVMDNTVIYLPSCMARNTHERTEYATAILAGKNTNLQGGFHYDCSSDDHTNNDLLVTLAQGVNVPITEHGGYRPNGNRVAELNNGPISKLLKTTLG